MAVLHYVARTITENPGYMQAKVCVPASELNGMHAGQVVVAENLDTKLGNGNYDVYVPEKVQDATKQNIAIILDGGFETLADGRRPDGNSDYTQYTFKPGEVVTAHRLLPEVRFEVSKDACGSTVKEQSPVVPGDKLIPENGQFDLKYEAKGTPVTAKNYLMVEATKYFRVGGQSGMEFATTFVVRANAAGIPA